MPDGLYTAGSVYMLQEYCRRLDRAQRGRIHMHGAHGPAARAPLARLLGESPDFQRRDALADALLNPQDRAYTVPQLFDFVERCGLTFGRWVRQAPYLAHCGSLAMTPHATRVAQLPPREQYAAVELFRGTMARHSLIVYRDDHSGGKLLPHFDDAGWLRFIPIRLPESISVRNRLPPGAAAVLINQSHTDSDLVLPVSATELQLVEAIDGQHSNAEIVHHLAVSKSSGRQLREQARSLLERLWWYDQAVFDTSGGTQ
jgi:hypothetical protein